MSDSLAGLETRVVRQKLTELRHLEGNARFMKAEQFNQLVANLARDGVLTSAPLIYRGEVLSGNHRVQAAIKAGIAEADCIEILSELTPSRRRAIALSHNAIVGMDDPSQLFAAYQDLDLGDKLYSGLTDDAFGAQELDLASLSAGSTDTIEVLLVFLPEYEEAFRKYVERLASKAKATKMLASMESFDRFFDTIVRVKGVQNILNTAMAVEMMVRLACERLDQIEAQAPSDDQAPSDAGTEQ